MYRHMGAANRRLLRGDVGNHETATVTKPEFCYNATHIIRNHEVDIQMYPAATASTQRQQLPAVFGGGKYFVSMSNTPGTIGRNFRKL